MPIGRGIRSTTRQRSIASRSLPLALLSMSPLHRAVLWLCLLPCGGCCTLASLFCGPDRSQWVSESYRSPAAAVATFQEAIRRDDATVAYRCLSESLKKREGILDQVIATAAWQKLQQNIPALHLLGEADRSEAQELPGGRVRYVLSRAGHRVQVDLCSQPLLRVDWSTPGGDDVSARYEPSLQPFLRIEGSGLDSTVILRIPDADLPGGLEALALRRVEAGIEWKVEDVRALGDHEGSG